VHLPEVVVDTDVGLNPALAKLFSFCRPFAVFCRFFFQGFVVEYSYIVGHVVLYFKCFM